MDFPGDIYKTDEGLCFVPDVDISGDQLIELMQLGIRISGKEYIEDDWICIGTINK